MAVKNNGSGIDYYELRRKHEEYLKTQRAQNEAVQTDQSDPVQAEPAAADVQKTVPSVETPVASEPVSPVPDADPAEPASETGDVFDDAGETAQPHGDSEGDDDYDDYDDGDAAEGGLLEPVFKVMKNAYHGIAGAISRKRSRCDDVLDDSDDSYSGEESDEPEFDEPQEKRGFLNIFRRRGYEEDFGEDISDEDAENSFDLPDDEPSETEASSESMPSEMAEDEEASVDVYAHDGEPAADIEIIEDIADIEEVPAAAVETGAETADEAGDACEAPEDESQYAPDDSTDEYADDDEYAAEDDVFDEAIDEALDDAVDDAIDDALDDAVDDAIDDAIGDDGVPVPVRSLGKRVMDLFIRIERDDIYDEDDYEVNEPDEPANDGPGYDDSLFVNDHRPYHGEEEAFYMEDQTRKTPDLTELMSDGMDEKILSRRERRELRMKQELTANAENASDAPEAPELSADAIVPDEPTREYQIVTRTLRDEPESDDAVFMDGDVADDDVAADKKPARSGLFGRSRKAAEDDYDDYDDDGYDDEDEEDDEPVKPRKARGKKAQKYEDDYDEDEDYDDYDDDAPRSRAEKSRRYDDYDDYDDDDYYDDYDDDDDAPGAGHYVLGFIKLVVALALILVVAVFGMYFADQAIEGGFAPYRFIAEKIPFISEYLPAAEQTPDLADPDSLTGDDADISGDADTAATPEASAEPAVFSEPDTSSDDASDEGETGEETEPASVG